MTKQRKQATQPAAPDLGTQLAQATAPAQAAPAPKQADATLYVWGAKPYRGRAEHYTDLHKVWSDMLPATATALATVPQAQVRAITNGKGEGHGMVPVRYFIARGWLVPQQPQT